MSILNWKNKVLGYTAQMGGGGSSGGGGSTQQANQYSGISPWAQPYVGSVLGAAQQQVFQTRYNPGQAAHYVDASGNVVSNDVAIAANRQAQQGYGYDSEGNYLGQQATPYTLVEGTPGSTEITGINPYTAYGYKGAGMSPEEQAAARAAVAEFTPLQQQAYQGAANLQLPGQYGQATGAALQGTGQALGAGQQYARQATDPYAVASYMNPYVQASLQPQLQLLAQQTGIQGAQQQSAATQVGAFGGSRSALQNALVQQQGNLAAQQAIAQGYNTAFNQAQQAQQFGANLGLQGSQAGISGANALSSIGGQQLAAQQGILGLQNQFGGQQQQQQQNIINAGMTNFQTAQQYPMTQLQQLAALGAPYVTKDVTTTQQQAQPSTASQLAGLGTAGVAGLALASKAAEGGLMKSYAAGGTVKGYAPGGIAALNRKALLAPESISPRQLEASTRNGAIAPQVSGIAKAIQLNEQLNANKSEALSKQAPQGTIMEELESKAAQMEQAEALPRAIAELKMKMEQAIQEGDIPLAQRYAAKLEELTQMADQQAPSAPAPEGIQQVAPQAGQMAQMEPQQGIEAAPSNLPTQTMAEGGIVNFANRGYVEDRMSKEEAEDQELEQLFGTGAENDFVQAVAARGKPSEIHPSAAITISSEPVAATGKGHKYESAVIKEAKRIGLPENIALHALYKETGGLKDPETARSKAGAIGVMQLMPATAKELGVNPHDPMENIQGGISYLKKMYDKYQDPRLALMAYNAGPGRVDRALKSKEGLASLPLETRNYKKGGETESDDLSLEDGIDNAYLKRSRNLVQGVKDIGAAFTNPENYDLYKMYQENIGGPFASAASRFVNESPEDQAARFRSYSQKVSAPAAAAPVVSAAPTTATAPAVSAPVAPSAGITQPKPDSLGRYPVTPIEAPTTDKVTPQYAAIKKAQDEVSGEKPQDIYQELLSDIKSRKEESKKQRETNNLLALMQAGFGMAASKNINPLAAVGEGGMQGLGALAQYRKQEGDEAKDIAAQQLGLYRYKSAADIRALESANLEKYRAATLGEKPSKEELIQSKADAAVSRNPEYARLAVSLEKERTAGGLTPEKEKRYQDNLNSIAARIYSGYNLKYTPPNLMPIEESVVSKPSWWSNLFGSSKPTSSGLSKEQQDLLNKYPTK